MTPDHEREAGGAVTRLSDLIRGQSSQEAVIHDLKSSLQFKEPTGVPFSPSAPETDWHHRASQELQRIKRAVQSQQPWELDELARVASGVVGSLGASDKLVQAVLQRDAGDYLVSNAVNVAILSVKIAGGLGYEPAKLQEVALAGLLHDLGMFVLPDSLVYKTGALTKGELQEMREHPQHGARLFQEVGEAYPRVGWVILQEHERLDGSGYPNRLAGDRIDEMAFVIGLADMFEALISPRPYRRGMSSHLAIRAVLVNGKAVFPHHLLKSLIDQLSIYPLGTTVRLNTGEIGVVYQLNRQYPLRPILQVTQEPQSGHMSIARTVDMRAETSLHIVEVVPIG